MASDLDGFAEPGPEPTPATDLDGSAIADGAGEDSPPDGTEPDVEPDPEPEHEAAPETGPELELEPKRVPALARFRALTALAIGPLFTGYLAIATLLALITGIAGNARFTTTGVLNAALPSWLAAHQVPIEIFGMELGILPLLPTLGVGLLTARAAARAATRLDLHRPGQAGTVIGTAVAAHGVAGLFVAALTVDAQVAADPLAAIFYPALVAAIAATAGVARCCGLLDALTHKTDTVAVAGLRAGALAVVLLLTAGGAVLTFGLLTSISTAKSLFPMGAGNATGMLLLSIGYVPNAMVAATSFVAGPGFSLGTFMVAPLEFRGGSLPGVPLLAALPEHRAAWWPALFVLPLIVGIVVGRRLRDIDEDPVARLRAVAVATGVVAVCFIVLAGTSGGRLGRGAFDPVSMRALALSIALVLWTAVPGAFVAWFGGPRPAAEPMPGLIDDAHEEPVEEAVEVPVETDSAEEPVAEESVAEEPDEPTEADDEEPEEAPAEEEGAELPAPRDAVEESGEVARD
jgi:hypothetical protein